MFLVERSFWHENCRSKSLLKDGAVRWLRGASEINLRLVFPYHLARGKSKMKANKRVRIMGV